MDGGDEGQRWGVLVVAEVSMVVVLCVDGEIERRRNCEERDEVERWR